MRAATAIWGDAEAHPPVAADRATWIACLTRAARASDPVGRVLELLRYLELFPTGAYNRNVAERIEDQLDVVDDLTAREKMKARFRALRDAVMPPLEPMTC